MSGKSSKLVEEEQADRFQGPARSQAFVVWSREVRNKITQLQDESETNNNTQEIDQARTIQDRFNAGS